MKHEVTKGDMCKAVRGNLLSSCISILLCQQKGDITEKQFLTDLNHIFDITISNYGMNKAVIAHVIKDALRC